MSGTDHLRRLAMQIAAQLPEDDGEAVYVLDLTRELVRHLSEAEPFSRLDAPERHRILRLVPGGAGADPIGPRDTASRE